MRENKLNYKLVNIVIILAGIYLLYMVRGLWIGIVSKIWQIILPFLLSFAIAYALYPLVKKLEKTGFPKWFANLLVCILTLGFVVSIIMELSVAFIFFFKENEKTYILMKLKNLIRH